MHSLGLEKLSTRGILANVILDELGWLEDVNASVAGVAEVDIRVTWIACLAAKSFLAE